MGKILKTIKHEALELVPPTVFFFISFCLLILTQNLISRQYGIPRMSFVGAAVGALIVAKVVLIVDHFSLVNRFPQKPLVYNVVWKTSIYFFWALVFRYFVHLFVFSRKFGWVG